MDQIRLRPLPVADTRPLHQRLLPEGVDRRPDWLTVKLPVGDGYSQIKGIMRGQQLNTVCEEARCPNIAECWGHGTATFMILGDVCTRACAFCAVKSGKRGGDIDWDEPRRVGEAVRSHAVCATPWSRPSTVTTSPTAAPASSRRPSEHPGAVAGDDHRGPDPRFPGRPRCAPHCHG